MMDCVLLPIDFFSTFEALFCSLGCGIFFLEEFINYVNTTVSMFSTMLDFKSQGIIRVEAALILYDVNVGPVDHYFPLTLQEV